MTRSRKNVRLIHAMLAVALLISLCPAHGRSQSPAATSAESKPGSSDQVQKSSKATGAPARDAAAEPSAEETSSEQIEVDVRKLHMLAAELRAEVGKTYKESLSVDVLKKAKEIEILSKSLKERMDKETAAARH